MKKIIVTAILAFTTFSSAFASCTNNSGYTYWPNSTYKNQGSLTSSSNPQGYETYGYNSCQSVAYQGSYYWTGCTISSVVTTSNYGAVNGVYLTCTNSPTTVS